MSVEDSVTRLYEGEEAVLREYLPLAQGVIQVKAEIETVPDDHKPLYEQVLSARRERTKDYLRANGERVAGVYARLGSVALEEPTEAERRQKSLERLHDYAADGLLDNQTLDQLSGLSEQSRLDALLSKVASTRTETTSLLAEVAVEKTGTEKQVEREQLIIEVLNRLASGKVPLSPLSMAIAGKAMRSEFTLNDLLADTTVSAHLNANDRLVPVNLRSQLDIQQKLIGNRLTMLGYGHVWEKPTQSKYFLRVGSVEEIDAYKVEQKQAADAARGARAARRQTQRTQVFAPVMNTPIAQPQRSTPAELPATVPEPLVELSVGAREAAHNKFVTDKVRTIIERTGKTKQSEVLDLLVTETNATVGIDISRTDAERALRDVVSAGLIFRRKSAGYTHLTFEEPQSKQGSNPKTESTPTSEPLSEDDLLVAGKLFDALASVDIDKGVALKTFKAALEREEIKIDVNKLASVLRRKGYITTRTPSRNRAAMGPVARFSSKSQKTRWQNDAAAVLEEVRRLQK